jgi:DNA-binding winged helix-turn-helix (wHTH) protein
MDVSRAVVRPGGTALLPTPMKYRVLEYLMHLPGIVITKNKLLKRLYDFNREKFSNVVEMYISGLRRKIDAESPTKLIHMLRRDGYVLRSGTVWPLRHLTNRYALHLSLFVLTGSTSSSCFDIGITSLQSSTKAGLFTNTRSCSGF